MNVCTDNLPQVQIRFASLLASCNPAVAEEADLTEAKLEVLVLRTHGGRRRGAGIWDCWLMDIEGVVLPINAIVANAIFLNKHNYWP